MMENKVARALRSLIIPMQIVINFVVIVVKVNNVEVMLDQGCLRKIITQQRLTAVVHHRIHKRI